MSMDDQNKKDLVIAFVAALILVVALCCFFHPRWSTNDDVGYSMAAHGYGAFLNATPKFFFSNVLWGLLVQSIPVINRVMGYSIATLGVLVVFAAVLFYALRKFRAGWLTSIVVLVFLTISPVLFPQFTINAGLMTVGAVICWRLYETGEGRRPAFICGCLLAFLGYLIRANEFQLVLFVALPLLPWKTMARDRFAQIAALFLLISIGGARYIDRLAYEGEEWRDFLATRQALDGIIDHAAYPLLRERPEILSQHGYSVNDLDLISSWFFADADILNPSALNAMLAELGPPLIRPGARRLGWEGVKALTGGDMVMLFMGALFLALGRPNSRLAATWALALAAFFLLGAIFRRPGVIRVYIPVLSLLAIAPFLFQNQALSPLPSILSRFRDLFRSMLRLCHPWRSWRSLSLGVLCALTFFITVDAIRESRALHAEDVKIRLGLKNFPVNTPVVIWGASFPLVAVYPVLRMPKVVREYQLYGLGTMTLAPGALSYAEQAAGRGMVSRLLSPEGIPIIANSYMLYERLATYCQERFGGDLKELASESYGRVSLTVQRCDR